MEKATPAATATPLTGLDADWFDPLEDAVRGQVRAFIEQLLEEELEAALGRGRYERGPAAKGHRNGHRDRRLDTTFGPLMLAVPRARLADDDAGEREWRSELLPAYQRLSRRAELLIAQVYLAGVNTRRVRRALQTLFGGRIGKDAVSRAWRKTRTAWEAWQQRDLTREDVVRLILDGTVVKVRLDRRATAISLLIVLGIRRDGQKVVLAIKNMGGESEVAWRAVLDDLLARGLAKRARRFVMAEWGWLASALCTLRADRATRLLLVLCLHVKLQRVADRAGWVELAQHDRKAVGLADSHLCRVVTKLETLGIVEVQRRPGKRPLLRLIKP
jgi:transposase-like protein